MRVSHPASKPDSDFLDEPQISGHFTMWKVELPMKLRMPSGLRRDGHGQKLWKAVTDEFDLENEPHKVALLTQACRVADRIHQLETASTKEPLTVLGSAQQKVIHPLISEVRFQRGLLAQLLGRLGLPDTDEAIAERAERLSATRRKAGSRAHLNVVSR